MCVCVCLQVRSVTLDMWQPNWITSMQQWGNDKVNAHWEYHMPKDYAKPDGNSSSLEQFIRMKYERKKVRSWLWCCPAPASPTSCLVHTGAKLPWLLCHTGVKLPWPLCHASGITG